MDQKVPAFAPIETSSELSAAIDMFNKLREEISEHSEEFRGVNNTGKYVNLKIHGCISWNMVWALGNYMKIIADSSR